MIKAKILGVNWTIILAMVHFQKHNNGSALNNVDDNHNHEKVYNLPVRKINLTVEQLVRQIWQSWSNLDIW